MSKPKKSTSLADMSLPPEQRRRRRKPGRIVTPPAQLDHANSPRARALRRDGERWLAAEELAREGTRRTAPVKTGEPRRTVRPYIAPFETGEPWRSSAEAEWDHSRD